MIRVALVFVTAIWLGLAGSAMAQDAPQPDGAAAPRAETGGAQTLEDILARQRGEEVQRDNRDANSAAGQAAGMLGALGAQGGTSDSLVWEDLRFNTADITVSSGGPADAVLVQDGGMWWLQMRAGPLRTYGGYLLLGVTVLLALFFLIRGRVRIAHGKAGVTIERFKPVERFAHWLLAGSFILLGITGLLSLFGRTAILPLLGKEANSVIIIASKWVHNNVSWAFMLALAMVFVFWVLQNIPNRHDIVWLLKGGGIFGKGHASARKFNAGQKIIFWSVIILGVSVSLTGLSLLFPFQMPMFAATFEKINAIGIPGWFGFEPLATTLAPHEEMQFAQLWHSIVSFVMMAIILAHIYIGTLGMEGAYDAMGSGQVDLQWAREHHDLWVEEVQAKSPPADTPEATPAE